MLTLPLKVQGLISSQRVKSGHAIQTRAEVLCGGAALLGKIVGMGINVVSSWNLLCHAHVSTLPATYKILKNTVEVEKHSSDKSLKSSHDISNKWICFPSSLFDQICHRKGV